MQDSFYGLFHIISKNKPPGNDEGIGISTQDIEKLFERYYRVENRNTFHIAGFGIGLYLSAEIINHHNGRIWVESEAGQGSTFYFSLPLN